MEQADLNTLKLGLMIGACVAAGIVVAFFVYWKIGEAVMKKSRKQKGLE